MSNLLAKNRLLKQATPSAIDMVLSLDNIGDWTILSYLKVKVAYCSWEKRSPHRRCLDGFLEQ